MKCDCESEHKCIHDSVMSETCLRHSDKLFMSELNIMQALWFRLCQEETMMYCKVSFCICFRFKICVLQNKQEYKLKRLATIKH